MKRVTARAPAPPASATQDALRTAANLLLGHFVEAARDELQARAPEAGRDALAAIEAGAAPMEIRAILLRALAA